MTLDNPGFDCEMGAHSSNARSCGELVPSGAATIQRVAVADASLLQAVFSDSDAARRAETALDDGKVVVTDSALLAEPDRAGLIARSARSDAATPVEVPATVVELTGNNPGELPDTFISAATAQDHGLTVTPSDDLLIDTTTAPTKEQIQAAHAVAARHFGDTVTLYVEQGYRERTATSILWAVLGLATITALGATLVASTLFAAESTADRTVLHTLGTAPRPLRGLLATQVATMTTLASLLGLAGGLLPTALALAPRPALAPTHPHGPGRPPHRYPRRLQPVARAVSLGHGA
ncbi:hypothetical protein [Salinactinospora qingdaonensis]|uniref:FtsX-like permease family protein n=1 Tax=Salinactinospora qingdaonensis TaxID=702744 RepID=A0ABP7GFJ5_9ACTN